MRNELEQIEKIEKYINGELAADEKAVFEAAIDKDPELQERINLQREILKGIERTMLKEKVLKASQRYRRGRNFRNWGGLGLGVTILALVVILLVSPKKSAEVPVGSEQRASFGSLPSPALIDTFPGAIDRVSTIDSNGKKPAARDASLPPQLYAIDAAVDTVVETRGGIVLSIPAGAFLEGNGQAVTGKIRLVLREALDAASIIRSGLSTMSGGRLLETGGMFFIDALQNGQRLQIDSTKSIYAEVPTDKVKPGMQLFTGRPLSNGTIDWQNPQPLEHNLVPRDIFSLDFYPPDYLDSLGKWGYNVRDKVFTDSLYYSFTLLFRDSSYVTEPTPAQAKSIGATDSIAGPPESAQWRICCGIDPARIKTIWSQRFQNTMIATREFEERLQWMHQVNVLSSREPSGGKLLDLYVNNMDKDLWEIDQMAVKIATGSFKQRFEAFARRKDGKVKNGVPQLNNLRKYYLQKSQEYSIAISKAQEIFWKHQAELDREAERKRDGHKLDSVNRINSLLREEFDLNLKEAYRQLGYDTTLPIRPLRGAVYQLRVRITGWCNVDRYVDESVATRTTLNYTDTTSGKQAIIRYLPASFRVEQAGIYDRLYVYLLSDRLSSFMRVSGSNGLFSEKLNELLTYDLVCIGYKGEAVFLFSQQNIEVKDYPSIVLRPVSAAELSQELNRIGKKAFAEHLQREDAFFLFDVKDQERQKNIQKLRDLRDNIISVLYHYCLRTTVY